MIEFPNPSIKMTAFKGFQFIEGFYNMIPFLMEKAIAAAKKVRDNVTIDLFIHIYIDTLKITVLNSAQKISLRKLPFSFVTTSRKRECVTKE